MRGRFAKRIVPNVPNPRGGVTYRPLNWIESCPKFVDTFRTLTNGKLLIGFARCSTKAQDLTAQRQSLLAIGVDEARIYVDHGLTGRNADDTWVVIC